MSGRTLICALALLCVPVLTCAQEVRLKLPEFGHLKQLATESVDVSIGAWPLGIAAWMVDEQDPQGAETREMLRGLQAVYVRSYEFASDFVYSKADVDAVREQLKAPVWSQLAQIRNRRDNEAVDIYVALENNQARGLAIIASDPREFTILNIVGPIDLDRLGRLETHLGLPRLGPESLGMTRKTQ